MPQGLIRIVLPLMMVLAFLLYVLLELPKIQTTNDSVNDPRTPTEAAE